MCEAVHIERCVACGGMHGVVQRKLNHREHRTPTLRRFSANAAQDVTDDAIDALGLSIGMRMIRCGHVQSCAEPLEDGLPKLSSESRVSLRNNCHRRTVLTKHATDNQRNLTLTVNGIRNIRQVIHLALTVNKVHNTPYWHTRLSVNRA